jgi:PP-loop superfamily ATP-utilizing enzyme
VRHFGDLARVEIAAGELGRWTDGDARARLDAAVRAAGYAQVELDPRGFRSGALNVLAGVA